MMRALIASLVLVLSILPSRQAVAQAETLAPNPAIEATIQSQFDAFASGDVETAWTFASPNIQRLFRTPENFGRMVEGGYPMVWSPGEVSFRELQSLGGLTVQVVQVIDAAGVLYLLGYAMIETEAGWQINGVQILQADQVGV